jgi:PadR family transcriptional regulator, regulatory protein PadR
MGLPKSRMRESTYFVLASLDDGPLSGYEIIKDVEEFSAGRLRLAVGTLYMVLDRLAGDGYVRCVGDKDVVGQVRNRYALTASGLTSLHAQARRVAMAGLVVQSSGGDRIGKVVTVGGRVRLGR